MSATESAHQGPARRQSHWEVCADAALEMQAILDEMEGCSDAQEQTAALREQLRRVELACIAAPADGEEEEPPPPRGDPRSVARGLVALLPLREIFRDKELSDAFLAELLLTIARESSHESRKELQRQGIAQAKAQGVRFGKPRRSLPENFEEMRQAWRDGECSITEAAEQCGLARPTFSEAVKRAEYARAETGGPKAPAPAGHGRSQARAEPAPPI